MAKLALCKDAAVVTPHASNPVGGVASALWVGTAGDITCRLQGSSADILLKNVPVGRLDLAVTHVRAVGTSAQNLVALYE